MDLRLDIGEVPLLIDLYELTMAASFYDHGYDDVASFDVALRKLGPGRGYMVAAGIERLLEVLEGFHFDGAALAYLDSLNLFKPDFLHFLGALRFTGEVRALAEGTLFFAEEPVIEVRGPLIEAQLLETIVLNQFGFASLVATKAARCFDVAGGRRLVEFGLRRCQGADAGLIAARSSYVAGFDGSSNVLAGRRYGIPVFGTMAHSFVMCHDHERDAFENFSRSLPQLSTLLVDTFDTVRGVENAAAVAVKLQEVGIKVRAIRLDSGDLLGLSMEARRILDGHGLSDVSIFATGDLDEFKLADLLGAGAPIDAFGIGTALDVSKDAPAADCVYKLSEYKGARLKTSAGKISLPGRKQVVRALSGDGAFYGDMIALAEQDPAALAGEFKAAVSEVRPLLVSQFEAGKRRLPRPTLAETRQYFFEGFAKLERRYRHLARPDRYPVQHSGALDALVSREMARIQAYQS